MGMFDYVHYQGKEYQSKDTPRQLMDKYEIRIDQESNQEQLWVEEYEAEYVEEEGYFLGGYLKQSTKPRYKDDYHMNGGYSSDLESFIVDRPQIKLWTHGHTHDEFDYMVGSTRVVCNPRGYLGHEESANTFKLKYIEV